MILGFPRAKQGLCHYDIWGGDPSLIRYSSKTAEQNFMKLSGIVHYMIHTAPPILSFYSNDFGVSQSRTRTLPYKTWGSGGYHFVSIAHSISSFCNVWFFFVRFTPPLLQGLPAPPPFLCVTVHVPLLISVNPSSFNVAGSAGRQSNGGLLHQRCS